jgi:hypothetical protein
MLNFKKFAQSGTRRLSDLPSFLLNIQKLTLWFAELGSRFLITNTYLREFEAKSRTARKVVKGIYEEPISAKPQKSASLPCPFKFGIIPLHFFFNFPLYLLYADWF